MSPEGAIRCRQELEVGTSDDVYLGTVQRSLQRALYEFTPDIIIYNGGTDILDGDPLGALSVSPQVS